MGAKIMVLIKMIIMAAMEIVGLTNVAVVVWIWWRLVE